MSDDLIIPNDYAEIREVKLGTENGKELHNNNCLRIYRQGYATFLLQIRTFKPITEFGNGVPRDMIANVTLDLAELKLILKYAENELKKDREGL